MRSYSSFLVSIGFVLAAGCGDDSKNNGNDGVGEESASETAGNDSNEGSDAEAEGDGDPTGDGDGDPTGDGDGDPTGDGDGDPTGDGDGDPTGDGDGDPTGDGDGDPTGDGDGDPTGDGDGDPNCLPEEIACDGIDEDCNGIIDDLDVGNDGFCDCYKIGIIGTKGANPAANFEAWLEDKGTTATRFGTMVNHQLTQDELAQFDILIIDRLTHVYSQQERDLLLAWIQAGHGVISMAGYTNSQIDVDQQNSLASVTGLSYSSPIYLNPVEVWENHPIAEGAQGVQVYGGWRVIGNGEVFVRPQGEPQNSLGTAIQIGPDGAAIVFSDEWISFDSEWQQIPQVEVFWSNMIEWVGPKSFCADPQ